MAALPYMPLYVADYLADAAHLTAAGHGAYLLLIMTYWQRGEPLPDDERKLMRIARMSPEEWEDVRDDMAEFFQVGDGVWRHKRIDAELSKVAEKSEARKSAAEKRWQSKGNANAMQKECHTDTDTDTDTDTKKEDMADSRPVYPPGFEKFWSAYPTRLNNPKRPCLDIWKRCLREGATEDGLVSAARAYSAWVAEERQKPRWDDSLIAQTQTWLRQRRYEEWSTRGGGEPDDGLTPAERYRRSLNVPQDASA